MNENFGDPSLDIASLAAVSNISPTYFRQLFAAEFGMPPMKYIRKLRIDLGMPPFRRPVRERHECVGGRLALRVLERLQVQRLFRR